MSVGHPKFIRRLRNLDDLGPRGVPGHEVEGASFHVERLRKSFEHRGVGGTVNCTSTDRDNEDWRLTVRTTHSVAGCAWTYAHSNTHRI